MKGSKFFTYGLYICLAMFLGSMAILLWPIISTPKFWLVVGLVVGMVGSFFFAVAKAQNSGNDGPGKIS